MCTFINYCNYSLNCICRLSIRDVVNIHEQGLDHRRGIISIALQISSSGCWLRLNFLPFSLLHIFCHVFSFPAATFSCFFLHSCHLGLVMPGRRGRPRTPYQQPAHPTGASASLTVVSTALSNLGAGTRSTGI